MVHEYFRVDHDLIADIVQNELGHLPAPSGNSRPTHRPADRTRTPQRQPFAELASQAALQAAA